jgi:hypothetical protein
VSPESAVFLSERLENPFTRVLRLETSTHVVTLGSEKERLFAEFAQFLLKLACGPGGIGAVFVVDRGGADDAAEVDLGALFGGHADRPPARIGRRTRERENFVAHASRPNVKGATR